jgi:uncharacterized protein (DUF1778 family)
MAAAGRPKNSDDRARHRIIPVRMNAEEHALLVRAAQARGLQLSPWLRSEMLTLAKKILSEQERKAE